MTGMNSPQRVFRSVFTMGVIGVSLCASLFFGLMLATAGGAIYPPTVNVFAPLICKGEVVAESHSYSYKPGQHGVTRETYCVEPSGQRKEITLQVVGTAFLMYSAILFVLSLLAAVPSLRALNRKTARLQDHVAQATSHWQAQVQQTGSTPTTKHVVINWGSAATHEDPAGGELAGRLKTLRQLREQNLISEQEYSAKKAEMLSGL
jgi:hypothetical protein